jgi:hypothetical protein
MNIIIGLLIMVRCGWRIQYNVRISCSFPEIQQSAYHDIPNMIGAFTMVREKGLEPLWTFNHPQEPESCASANFATLAS